MELSFAFFADSATVPPDGKLYVLGGGISLITLPTLPGRVGFAIIGGFRFTDADAGQTHSVELRFVDSEGKMVIPAVPLQFQLPANMSIGEGRELSLHTVSIISPMFGDAGIYAGEFWVGETLLGRATIYIDERQPPAPGPGQLVN